LTPTHANPTTQSSRRRSSGPPTRFRTLAHSV
jgi:hypothetical protein